MGDIRRVVPGRPGPGTVPLLQVAMAGSDSAGGSPGSVRGTERSKRLC